MKGTVVPRENDVLFGRGNGFSLYPGNVRFRRIIWSYRNVYRNAERHAKKIIGRQVVEEIMNCDPPARFIEFQEEKTFVLVECDQRILEKTCQALREKKLMPPKVVVENTPKNANAALQKINFGKARRKKKTLAPMTMNSERSCLKVKPFKKRSKPMKVKRTVEFVPTSARQVLRRPVEKCDKVPSMKETTVKPALVPTTIMPKKDEEVLLPAVVTAKIPKKPRTTRTSSKAIVEKTKRMPLVTKPVEKVSPCSSVTTKISAATELPSKYQYFRSHCIPLQNTSEERSDDEETDDDDDSKSDDESDSFWERD